MQEDGNEKSCLIFQFLAFVLKGHADCGLKYTSRTPGSETHSKGIPDSGLEYTDPMPEAIRRAFEEHPRDCG